jgi:2-methylcitrate dehydratase PrpD
MCLTDLEETKMIHQAPLAEVLARWAAEQARTGLPKNVRQHMRRMILDHLGGVVASSVGEVSRAVATHVARQYGEGSATAVGLGKTTALGAAVLNGTNGHGIEADDGYTPGSFHPTSVILPAVFAVAQEKGLKADAVLLAAAIGMEVGCRIAAAGHPATRKNHFHNTPVAGVFGAAAATAVLLGLDQKGIANALGIAGSHASGLFEFLGQSAEVKRLHPGKAARDGIASADLAAAGLTGPTTILEGRDGYFAAYAGSEGEHWFIERLLDGLGEKWFVLGTYIKPYPCCRHLHGAIDAVLELRRKHNIDWREVTKLHVATFPIAAGHNGTNVETMMGAQLSMPYALAVALRKGGVTLTDFSDDERQDQDMHAIMQLVEVEVDSAADAAYPRSGRPAEVSITLNDGTEHRHRVEQPYGESSNPMSNADLENKVRDLVEPVIGSDGSEQLIKSAWEFTDLAFLDDIDQLVRSRLSVPLP